MYEIIPAILEKEWSEIERKIELVKPFARSIHVDIIDGKFVDNTTFFDPQPFKKYTQDLFFEVHMMVEDPLQYVQVWADAGFRRFLGHVEKMPDQAAFTAAVQQVGEVGLALDGPTPVSAITVPFIDLDTILIYTSERVGFSGPPLLPDRLEKLRQISETSTIPLAVDGGINEDTISDAFRAGARRFGVTSGIFKSADPANAYTKFHSVCDSLLLA